MRDAGAIGRGQKRKAPSPGPFSVTWSATLLRERDSNARPSGYEPDELPLLHPAIVILARQRVPKKSGIHRAMRLAGPASTCTPLALSGERSTAIKPSPFLTKS